MNLKSREAGKKASSKKIRLTNKEAKYKKNKNQ
jgi:hypothetical protein